MTSANLNSPVLVTGGSGYIGFRIVYELLKKNYKVHTTTRSLESSSAKKLKKLQADFPNQLRIFEADLLAEGAYEESLKGVKAVLHVATPVNFNPVDAERDMVKPAVQGTMNVLNSCLDSNTLETIIVTSSTSSVFANIPTPGVIYDESNWNTISRIDFNPYAYSKTLAEKKFWEFAEENKTRFRFVAINPCVVAGPYVFPELEKESENVGVGYLTDILFGRGELIQGEMNLVDVRDVAQAQIAALEKPTITGRNIICSSHITWAHIADLLKQHYPDQPIVTKSSEEKWERFPINNSKSIEELGMQYIDVDQVVLDSVKQFI